ncbi:hypothetical protein WJX77_005020 [Trebouxia sp. C0004]
MAEQVAPMLLEEAEQPGALPDALLQDHSDEQQEGIGPEEPVDDTGELDFTYDDSLLQGEEEEDTAVLATQQKEQEDQESERRKKERERNWGPSSANALPAHTNDMPAHSRHSSTEHADRQRGYQRSQRPIQSSRGREPYRGRSNYPQSREGLQDQSRRAEGPRGPSAPALGAPARRQPSPGTASVSHQYPRAMPPGPQQSGHQEFDPGLLFQLLQAPSFAPATDEMNQNKRKHDQLQAPAAGPTAAASIPPEVMHFLNRISQQSVNLPMLQQMQPDGFFNGMRPPHHAMMGPAVPPPRPPQGPPPPPPGPKPHLPHSAAPFFGGAPNFAPLTSIPMDSRPQSGNPPLEVLGVRPRQKPPGWSLSHGMEGFDRTGNGQEPMLAADMVWDAEGQGNASCHDAGPTRLEPFRNSSAGQRTGMPGGGAVGPRGPTSRPPAPAQNKAAELAKSQAALAAAKARFAQQQKENEEIAERTKRQRLGLPEPRPVYQETEIDRLKRQIAEKEAAVKAGQALLPADIKSAPPSSAKSRAQSVSPSPSSAPGGSTPPSAAGSGHTGRRIRSAIVRPESAEPRTDSLDKWHPSEEGQSGSTRVDAKSIQGSAVTVIGTKAEMLGIESSSIRTITGHTEAAEHRHLGLSIVT